MLRRNIICLTPDARYFKQAVFAARMILRNQMRSDIDIAILCEPQDVDPRHVALATGAGNRLQVLTCDFARLTAHLPLGRHITPAAYRRLFLATVLPAHYERILYLDSDVAVIRPGLAELFDLPLGGAPVAAAIDMIFLKDFEEGPLTPQFRAYRQRLGLALDAPYLNSGVLLIDRAQWQREDVTERVLDFARQHPDRCTFHDQSALNAVLNGRWARLSPRFNFMGDFLLLDLEEIIEPVVLHFVNEPKPWHFDEWQGEPRFAEFYRREFALSPWWRDAPGRPLQGATWPKATLSPGFERFRERLLDFLSATSFVDLGGKPCRQPTPEPLCLAG